MKTKPVRTPDQRLVLVKKCSCKTSTSTCVIWRDLKIKIKDEQRK